MAGLTSLSTTVWPQAAYIGQSKRHSFVHLLRKLLHKTLSTPETWGKGSADSNVNVKVKTETPRKVNDKFIITNIWSVAQGDPSGEYQFNISIDNTHIKTFKVQFRE